MGRYRMDDFNPDHIALALHSLGEPNTHITDDARFEKLYTVLAAYLQTGRAARRHVAHGLGGAARLADLLDHDHAHVAALSARLLALLVVDANADEPRDAADGDALRTPGRTGTKSPAEAAIERDAGMALVTWCARVLADRGDVSDAMHTRRYGALVALEPLVRARRVALRSATGATRPPGPEADAAALLASVCRAALSAVSFEGLQAAQVLAAALAAAASAEDGMALWGSIVAALGLDGRSDADPSAAHALLRIVVSVVDAAAAVADMGGEASWPHVSRIARAAVHPTIMAWASAPPSASGPDRLIRAEARGVLVHLFTHLPGHVLRPWYTDDAGESDFDRGFYRAWVQLPVALVPQQSGAFTPGSHDHRYDGDDDDDDDDHDASVSFSAELERHCEQVTQRVAEPRLHTRDLASLLHLLAEMPTTAYGDPSTATRLVQLADQVARGPQWMAQRVVATAFVDVLVHQLPAVAQLSEVDLAAILEATLDLVPHLASPQAIRLVQLIQQPWGLAALARHGLLPHWHVVMAPVWAFPLTDDHGILDGTGVGDEQAPLADPAARLKYRELQPAVVALIAEWTRHVVESSSLASDAWRAQLAAAWTPPLVPRLRAMVAATAGRAETRAAALRALGALAEVGASAGASAMPTARVESAVLQADAVQAATVDPEAIVRETAWTVLMRLRDAHPRCADAPVLRVAVARLPHETDWETQMAMLRCVAQQLTDTLDRGESPPSASSPSPSPPSPPPSMEEWTPQLIKALEHLLKVGNRMVRHSVSELLSTLRPRLCREDPAGDTAFAAWLRPLPLETIAAQCAPLDPIHEVLDPSSMDPAPDAAVLVEKLGEGHHLGCYDC
ncbi:hypothetical protein CXG81DRAFT_26161 [Caulochytrium protostelioides]|uniref:Uncharacterized protein n=1 Tax=Caulochytrium protostelioides TaxID=1555241 RepID=A0A4P9X7D2_9FUNG|nr:hypothetical protein CXG81DRAFT_26161 [Caulochytrium protostelioides]|eukprot:RKP01146.1 hypothetical protein CXG81DRAFT_26161 [Caulochytrium protostelioides]